MKKLTAFLYSCTQIPEKTQCQKSDRNQNRNIKRKNRNITGKRPKGQDNRFQENNNRIALFLTTKSTQDKTC